MVNYNLFNTSQDHSLNVFNAMKYCKEHGEDGIFFPCGEYHFYPEMASEQILCVSNNDIYGYRRIAFSISDTDNFCIDGNGSSFIFHGHIIPFYIKGSKNITVKNIALDYEKTRTLVLKVINRGENFFEAEVTNSTEYKVENGTLLIRSSDEKFDSLHFIMIRTVGDSDEYEKGVGEEFLCMNNNLSISDMGERKLRFEGSELDVKVGMRLTASSDNRTVSNIVINKSKDVTLDNLTMYSSYSMGVLAQMCENVTIDKMTVQAHEGEIVSLSTDATHFVNCRGLVKVTNSSFSNQLDDALNVHGIYTRITHAQDNYIIVKYMHKSAKGIDIFNDGDEICILNPRSLVAGKYCKVEKVEVINQNYTKLYLDIDTSDVTVGYDVENITNNCDLLFEGNRVFKNRARGMLVGTRGKVEIKNNYFHTSGASILFESDGEFWFESGGTTDVKISGNTFDRCCIGPEHWGNSVIETVSRKEDVEGEYYHKSIIITDNEFIGNTSTLLIADNIESLVFKNNKSDREMLYDIKRCKTVDIEK